MLGSERRVVITGLGLVTPLGDRPDSVWTSLAEGRGAVRRLEAFRVAGLPNDVAAEVHDFDLKKYALPKYSKELRKSRKYMARDIQLAVAAAQLAVADAGLVDGGVDPTRIGIDLGAGLISSELDELAPAIGRAFEAGHGFDFQVWGRESIGMIEPIWLLEVPAQHAGLPHLDPDRLPGAEQHDHRGRRLGQPGHRRGGADHRPGPRRRDDHRRRRLEDPPAEPGADGPAREHVALERRAVAGLPAVRPPSRRLGARRGGGDPDPRGARARAGAAARGSTARSWAAAPAATPCPAAASTPRASAPRSPSPRRSRTPGSNPSDIGHVNAHGSATRVSDLAEARALQRIFGPGGVPVTALKGYMGNLVSGCGAVELIGSLVGGQSRADPADPQLR